MRTECLAGFPLPYWIKSKLPGWFSSFLPGLSSLTQFSIASVPSDGWALPLLYQPLTSIPLCCSHLPGETQHGFYICAHCPALIAPAFSIADSSLPCHPVVLCSFPIGIACPLHPCCRHEHQGFFLNAGSILQCNRCHRKEMQTDAFAGWGGRVSQHGGGSPPARWMVAQWRFFCSVFLMFCVGEKSLVLVSTGENYTLMALVRDNAALPVFWFSRRDGLNIHKTLPQRSRTWPSRCSTGWGGRHQQEADGQHSMWFAWRLQLCNWKLRNELQWDQRKRKKNIETHQYSEETNMLT